MVGGIQWWVYVTWPQCDGWVWSDWYIPTLTFRYKYMVTDYAGVQSPVRLFKFSFFTHIHKRCLGGFYLGRVYALCSVVVLYMLSLLFFTFTLLHSILWLYTKAHMLSVQREKYMFTYLRMRWCLMPKYKFFNIINDVCGVKRFTATLDSIFWYAWMIWCVKKSKQTS